VVDEMTDEDLDLMILRELRDDGAHRVTTLAEVAGESGDARRGPARVNAA